MFKALVLLAAVFRVVDEALVQFAYMRNSQNDKRTYKQTSVCGKGIFSTEELEGWDGELGIDERVATFRRGLQRQQFHERAERAA